MPKHVVSLYFMPDDVMLVVEHPTGVVYRNQVGGHYCLQKEVEGALVPIDFADADVERIKGLDYASSARFTESLADKVDAVLAAQPRARFLKVDRSRLRDSCEAWVFVIADTPSDTTESVYGSDYFGSCFGFGLVTGVLTWHNSD